MFWLLRVCFEPSYSAQSARRQDRLRPLVLLLEMALFVSFKETHSKNYQWEGMNLSNRDTLKIYFRIMMMSSHNFQDFSPRFCVLLLDGENVTNRLFHHVDKRRSHRDFTGKNSAYLNIQSQILESLFFSTWFPTILTKYLKKSGWINGPSFIDLLFLDQFLHLDGCHGNLLK